MAESFFILISVSLAADLFPSARIRFAAEALQFGLARAAQSFLGRRLIFLSWGRVRIRRASPLATGDEVCVAFDLDARALSQSSKLQMMRYVKLFAGFF
jgi:hypothetical protein